MRGLQSAKVGLPQPLAVGAIVVVVSDGAIAGEEGIKSEGLMR